MSRNGKIILYLLIMLVVYAIYASWLLELIKGIANTFKQL
uniref:Uncharacterized protein n=1 Tax=Siphoviridae sp. cthL03 TaxID=2825615 RepID=A0A8S5PGN9_9CAUD|nr:MAG TPA: hypothetical protein [Siphoviridae sp. cthL03]